jgi:hypothetical protein
MLDHSPTFVTRTCRPAARERKPCPAAQPRTSRSGIGCGSCRPCRRPEPRSAARLSACERGPRSCGTCPAARSVDGDKRVAARCSVRCRIGHRQLARQGRHRARRSSCAAADRRRWTGCRSPHSRRASLLVRISPLRTKHGRGLPRRGFYQDVGQKADSTATSLPEGLGAVGAFPRRWKAL